MGRKRRRFSSQFKKDAVNLVAEGGVTIGQAARDLDIYETTLRRWMKNEQVENGEGPAGTMMTGEAKELRRLRRENRTLKMEREILKKATAFFAKESE